MTALEVIEVKLLVDLALDLLVEPLFQVRIVVEDDEKGEMIRTKVIANVAVLSLAAKSAAYVDVLAHDRAQLHGWMQRNLKVHVVLRLWQTGKGSGDGCNLEVEIADR